MQIRFTFEPISLKAVASCLFVTHGGAVFFVCILKGPELSNKDEKEGACEFFIHYSRYYKLNRWSNALFRPFIKHIASLKNARTEHSASRDLFGTSLRKFLKNTSRKNFAFWRLAKASNSISLQGNPFSHSPGVLTIIEIWKYINILTPPAKNGRIISGSF
jgi:hypothetical protein